MHLSIYPHPVSGALRIEAKAVQSGTIQFLNTLGQAIYSAKSNPGTTKIDVSGFAPGIYWVHLRVQGVSQSFKVVKINR